MPEDNEYQSVPFVYRSAGLVARSILDQAPPFTYLDNLNCLEREENAMSSRFGSTIINRDPVGVGTSNYFFNSSVVSLAKLAYQSTAARYAGLSNGTLQYRNSNIQGAYSQIYTGLSGQSFQTLIASCFQSAQPYIFIFDAAVSIKDNGSGSPQLTGIDPPPYTASAVPYSPLLTLIDNFATGNSYTTSGFSVAWTFGSIATLAATGGSIVTDFPDFTAAASPQTIAGGTTTATQTGAGSTATLVTLSGFPSVATSGAVVTLSVPVSGSFASTVTGPVPVGSWGSASVQYAYSTDSGGNWTPFYTLFQNIQPSINTGSFPSTTVTVPVSGLTNLNQLEVKVTATSTLTAINVTLATTGSAGTITASVNTAGVFGTVCNGILSNLNTNASINVPIINVASVFLGAGLGVALPSGSTVPAIGAGVAIYGSSNPIADGFYTVDTHPLPGSLDVLVPSPLTAPISSNGGILHGSNTAATNPACCILNNLYSSPYPAQFSAWGFGQPVLTSTASFPVGNWFGTVAASGTATVGKTVALDLSINNQVTDDDLIVLTMKVGSPANITNIRLQFDVNSSGYTSAYYYKDIAPSYYQGNIANQVGAYQATQQQILADTLGLITGLPPDSTSAQLQPSNFSTGSGSWTAIYMRRGDFLPVGNAGSSGLDWSNITGWQLVINTGTTGSSTVAVNGLYLQWGYGPSSFGGVGLDYRYTYFDATTGTESNGSPEQNFDQQFGYLSTLTPLIVLRQAVQVNGVFSSDPQVTHVRVYRRGGTRSDNWYQIDEFPNTTGTTPFSYKDVISDAALQQSNPLVLDNDPPVTSTLLNPISTTLSAATLNQFGQTAYQPTLASSLVQTVTVQQNTAVFVPEQLVLVGSANNLEQVRVVMGGTGQFSAVFNLQHNAGEPVIVYSLPRVPCTMCAWAYEQQWLGGDPYNLNVIYYSKKGYIEAFGPQNRVIVSTADDPVTAMVNWRGTLVVSTRKTWWIIVGGANPYPQPTGATHGCIGQNAWCIVEGALWFRASDGWRVFTGANADYATLGVEWIFLNNPLCIPPQAYKPDATQDVFAFYRNQVFGSYVSLQAGGAGPRYRLVHDTQYKRYRYDDVPATAMLWERDTDALLVGKQIGVGQYAVVQDQVGDYDDGGWVAGALVQTPINLSIQTPYEDLKAPHNPKQWNAYETDVNTQGATMHSTLLFEDGTVSLALTDVVTTSRQKVELKVNAGAGEQAYRASIKHTMAVTVAPILYQEDIYATKLASYTGTFDSYWIKFGIDEDKFVKQGWFDYTSAFAINVNLFADNSATPYFSFTLPAQAQRDVVRVRFGNVNPASPAFTMRTWRVIGTLTTDGGANQFQMWAKPRVQYKSVQGGSSYQVKELEV